jgi:hypothetical protein
MNGKRLWSRLFVISASLFLSSYALCVGAETLSDYVSACKSQLGFNSIPQFTCKSENFRHPANGLDGGLDFSQSSDWVGHRRINDSVDAVFACRWVEQNNNLSRAVAGEMIVHNRRTGGTCFFDLKDTNENRAYPEVDIKPASPTSSSAANIWNIGGGCTRCHSAGPYIASPQIVGALSKFGLINDGHDVINAKYFAAGPVDSQIAKQLNLNIQDATLPGCSDACHSLGGTPAQDSIVGAGLVFGAVVMPSINHVIDEVIETGKMPPDDPYSDSRWMNHEAPGGTGEWELLKDEASQFKALYATCQAPTMLEAHVLDSSDVFSTADDIPDELHTFNMRDGLECRNKEQRDGTCNDYQLRYMCNGTWTDWINNDSPAGNGDYERRTDPGYKEICSSPTEMQARTTFDYHIPAPISITKVYTAPNDRLAAFDPAYGLACVNEDQPDKKCFNYVVRFSCPD